MRRGAIDFDDREAEIIVDEKGHAVDIKLRVRGLAERMIESFMLATATKQSLRTMIKQRHRSFTVFMKHQMLIELKVSLSS